jgi:hypothetical protein
MRAHEQLSAKICDEREADECGELEVRAKIDKPVSKMLFHQMQCKNGDKKYKEH